MTVDTSLLPQWPFEPGPLGAPPPQFAAWRTHEPLTWIRTLAGDAVLQACGYDDVRFVLADPRFSREATLVDGAPRMMPGYDPGSDPAAMGTMDPPRLTRLRKLVAGPFAVRHVDSWRALAAAQAAALIDTMEDGGSRADLATQYAYPLPIGVICQVLGIGGDQVRQFQTWAGAFLAVTNMSAEDRAAAVADFRAGIGELIQAERRRPGTGLLADLVAAHDEVGDRLTYDELVRTVLSIIVAGHATTAGVIARGVLRLLMAPESWAALVADPAAVPSAVEELLRMEVPGHSGRLRVATVDLTMPSGVRIPAGTGVLPVVSAANRDPDVFPDPDRYIAGRPNIDRHLAFAAGPHHCLGAPLARVEIVEALRALVTRLPGLRLDADPGSLPWSQGADLVSLLSLPVAY